MVRAQAQPIQNTLNYQFYLLTITTPLLLTTADFHYELFRQNNVILAFNLPTCFRKSHQTLYYHFSHQCSIWLKSLWNVTRAFVLLFLYCILQVKTGVKRHQAYKPFNLNLAFNLEFEHLTLLMVYKFFSAQCALQKYFERYHNPIRTSSNFICICCNYKEYNNINLHLK